MVIALAALACGPGGAASDGVTAVFRLVPPSPAVGTAELELRLVDAAGEALDGATAKIEANMNHAGMTPTFAELVESATEPGLYRGQVEFTMGGDWFLLLEARLPDGRLVERTLDLPGVRTP